MGLYFCFVIVVLFFVFRVDFKVIFERFRRILGI